MRTFDISIVQDTVAVKQGEQAILTFTVTNVSGRDLRALLRLVPENDEHVAWLRVEGEGRREVGSAQSDNIVVRIKPPQGAPPGAGKFRLVVASEENPDEDFADAVAQFTVEQAPQAPAPERRPRPWWIIAAAAGAVVVVVAVIAVLLRQEPPLSPDVTVPDVVGYPFEKAWSTLVGEGFLEDHIEKNPTEGTGIDYVAAQFPEAGTEVRKNTKVILSMRRGWIEFKNQGPADSEEFRVVFKVWYSQDGERKPWESRRDPRVKADPRNAGWTLPEYADTCSFEGSWVSNIQIRAVLDTDDPNNQPVIPGGKCLTDEARCERLPNECDIDRREENGKFVVLKFKEPPNKTFIVDVDETSGNPTCSIEEPAPESSAK